MVDKKRLVDANELLRDAEDYGPISGELAGFYDVKWLVDAQPTVDAVEVVRCKDCRFIIDRNDGTHGCYRHLVDCKVEDFCSYGERRTT